MDFDCLDDGDAEGAAQLVPRRFGVVGGRPLWLGGDAERGIAGDPGKLDWRFYL